MKSKMAGEVTLTVGELQVLIDWYVNELAVGVEADDFSDVARVGQRVAQFRRLRDLVLQQQRVAASEASRLGSSDR